MIKRNNNRLKIYSRKVIAVFSAAALMFSCSAGTIGAYAGQIDTVASAAAAASQISVYNNTRDMDISDTPNIYLDNTDIADGKTMNTVTVTLADSSGKAISGDDSIAYKVSEPNSCIRVENVTESGVTSSVKLNIYATTKDNKPLSAGTVSITFSNRKGTVSKVLRCSVYTPATDMLVYWNGSEEPLPLNDFCPTNSTTITAVENHSYTLNASVIPSNSNDTVTWAVSDGNYSGEAGTYIVPTENAFVSTDGIFTASGAGEVTIVGKFAMTGSSARLSGYGDKKLYVNGTSGETKTSRVKTVPKYIHVNIIKENPAMKIAFTDAPSAMAVGEKYKIKSEITPTYTGAGYKEATDALRWVSSNRSVATVSSDGTVTAVGTGDATITLYGENPDVYAEQRIKVINTTDSVVITPSPAKTRVGVAIELTATMSSENADDEIVWKVSDESVAKIVSNNNGSQKNKQTAILTGVSEGKVTVTATASVSKKSATVNVTVEPRIATDGLGVVIESDYGDVQVAEGTTLSVYTNQDIKLKALLAAVNGSDPDDTVEWEISNNDNDYITLPDSEGNDITIHGSSEGTALIKAYAKGNKSISLSFYVQVLKACDSIRYLDDDGGNMPTYKSINVGSLIRLNADLRIDGNYPYQHSDRVVSWESTKPEVASVDDSGNVRGISNGSATIKLKTASGKTSSKDIKVFTTSQVIITNVKSSDDGTLPTASINMNNQYQGSTNLNVSIRNQDGENVKYADAIWTSSDPTVATVDSKGKVTAASLGRTTITVQSGRKYDQCNLSVCASVKLTDVEKVETQYYSPLVQYYEPKPVITYNNTALIEGVDYNIDYKNNTGLGKGSMTITGDRYFTESRTISFDIKAKPLTDEDVVVTPIEPIQSNNEAQTPTPTITCSGILLAGGTDFTCTYANNKKTGTATITIKGKGNYTGTISQNFEIVCSHADTTEPVVKRPATCSMEGLKTCTCNICGETVELPIPMVPHQYEDKVVPPTANEEGYTLHTCKVCKESYKDTFVDKIPGTSILDCTVFMKGDTFAYTGEQIKPGIVLKYKDKQLTQNVDFLVTYFDNIEMGTAYAIITGLGNYVGTGKISFEIAETGATVDTDVEAEMVTTDEDSDTDDGRISIASKEVEDLDPIMYDPTAAAYEPRPVISLRGNALIENVDFTFDYANNTEVGTATIVMTGIGKFKGVRRYHFEILPKPLTDADMTVRSIATQKCTGKEVTPSPIVICNGVILTNRKDYKVTFTSNISPGIATATITGIGNYTDSVSVPFRIECDHDYTETVVAPTYTARGYTLHTCKICGESFQDNYVDQLKTSDLKNCTIQLEYETTAFTGEPREPSVIITYNGVLLKKGSDFSVEYSNNVKIGKADVTITGIGEYTGIVIKSFQIFGGTTGDVNFDGVVTADDALMTLRSTVGIISLDESQQSVADVNGDGSITTEDSLAILRHTVGFIDPNLSIGK